MTRSQGEPTLEPGAEGQFKESNTNYTLLGIIIERLAHLRLTAHEREAQVTLTQDGIPWLGFVVYPTHRRLKRRNAVNFTRRLERNIDLYESGAITFAELDASVQGWINHVHYADT